MALLNLLLTAVGLSMDTFSLSLTYGLIIKEKNTINKVSISVGLFHFFMPLIGNIVGEYILNLIKINVEIVESIVFLSIAIELLLSLFKNEEIKDLPSFLSIITFSFAVSIDSFIVGIGLDAITKNHLFSSFIFMITSFLFTYIGLFLGKKIRNYIGKKADVIGIFILIILSINCLVHFI